MKIVETERLSLRWLAEGDAGFILDLLNQPSWLKYIGDRGVRTIEDAYAYINDGPLAMIKQHGHGLYLIESRCDATPLGLCGLLRRDTLEDVDIGFALHPDAFGKGFAKEAAQACMQYARNTLKLNRVVAIVMPVNVNSIKLLQSLGMQYEKDILFGESRERLLLFSINFQQYEPVFLKEA